MDTIVKTITINGEEYIRKADLPEQEAKKSVDGMRFCIVRTYRAGVFAGYLKSRDGMEAVMVDAIRIWYWKGAASLSELSQHGVTCPNECKFPCAVPEVELTQVIEVIPCSEKARISIQGVPEWKMRQ